MMGFALLTGLAAFVGVKIALRHHGRWRGHWGHRCGQGGWGRHHYEHWTDHDDFDGGEPGGWRGGGGPVMLRMLFHRIGARPDQQDTIRAAVDELKDTAGKLRGEGRRTRQEVADAFRKPSFDEVAMGELFARHDSAIETLRKAVVGTLAKTHDALDERQRQRLADLIASGRRAFGGWGW